MSSLEERKKDVAGHFHQAMRAKIFALTHRLFPDFADQLVETADREVEEKGLQAEGIEVIRLWIRSEKDAQWLEDFWQSPEGSRFLELSVELMTRAMFRRFVPEAPLPPPGKA